MNDRWKKAPVSKTISIRLTILAELRLVTFRHSVTDTEPWIASRGKNVRDCKQCDRYRRPLRVLYSYRDLSYVIRANVGRYRAVVHVCGDGRVYIITDEMP